MVSLKRINIDSRSNGMARITARIDSLIRVEIYALLRISILYMYF